MTAIPHLALSLPHKRVLCGGGCRCLLLILCHHYVVTDRITKVGVREGEGRWTLCNHIWGQGSARLQESAHLWIHLHVSKSQTAAEDLLTQGGRTQPSALTSISDESQPRGKDLFLLNNKAKYEINLHCLGLCLQLS